MSYLIQYNDPHYKSLYSQALEATQMEHSEDRYNRFWHMLQAYNQTNQLPGLVAECGSWRGMSSYMMLEHTARKQPHRQETHIIIDSFEGLSAPGPNDVSSVYSADQIKGRFACSLETVKENLSRFSNVQLVKGWIPQVLAENEAKLDKVYRFVHIDVEMYEPTLSALKFFWPRMGPGGMIVCDDCGYNAFPGSQHAMESFAQIHGLSPMYLTTGNGILIKR